jgi:hypothetical protein
MMAAPPDIVGRQEKDREDGEFMEDRRKEKSARRQISWRKRGERELNGRRRKILLDGLSDLH